MKAFKELTHFAGLDWARDHHAVVVVNAQGQMVEDLEFEHTQAGWQQLGERLARWPDLAVAIETSRGAAVVRTGVIGNKRTGVMGYSSRQYVLENCEPYGRDNSIYDVGAKRAIYSERAVRAVRHQSQDRL